MIVVKKNGASVSCGGPVVREWIAPDLAAAWLVMIGAPAVAEAGQVALTLNFTLNL